jgi:hypothetical protein
MQRFKGMVPSLLAAIMVTPAVAATFCTTTPAQLQAALGSAAGNGEHDEVRIGAGTYDVSNVDLVYDPAAQEDFDLEISGGWTPFFQNPCGQQLAREPWQTTLDGNGQGRILRLSIDEGQADVSVRLIAFVDGLADPGLGGGLSIGYGPDATGSVSVERNAFLLNAADQASALSVQGASLQKITNNLFLLNQGASRAAAYLTTTQPLGVSFTNNTVIGHAHSNANQPTVAIAAGRALFANNHFWDNDGYDFSAGATGDRFVYDNNYESFLAHGGEILDGNLSVEPEYQAGFLNYTPVRDSPLVDAGREPTGSAPLWDLTEVDLRGAARLVGPHVDIGAFENETILVDGFDLPGPFAR